MKKGYVYIMTNKPRGTLYIGMTKNLQRRIFEHKQHFVRGFTGKYNLDKLVFYEERENIVSAIEREKELKRWLRQWKIELIESINPSWEDLEIF